MNTKISMLLPESLLKKAIRLSRAPTKTKAVIWGLEELVRKKQLKDFFSLRGSKQFRLSKNDLKKMRKR